MKHRFSRFRKTATVIRKSGGHTVNGLWEKVLETTFEIKADIQSLRSEEMQSLPEGRESDATNKMYTSEPLNAIGKDNIDNPDIVIVNGQRFEVLACYILQHDVINHYKIMLKRSGQGL